MKDPIRARRILLAAAMAGAIAGAGPGNAALRVSAFSTPVAHGRLHYVLLHSLVVRGIPLRMALQVRCARCLRVDTPIRKRWLSPTAKRFDGLNWIIGAKKTVTVSVVPR